MKRAAQALCRVFAARFFYFETLLTAVISGRQWSRK